jgi:tRNA/tmRNA/rRNA uracil-C5-methylase (TrmA/RlmC/RlmD family)
MDRVSKPEEPGATAVRAGDILELAVGEAVHGGWCVTRAGSDRAERPARLVVLVRHALPGERVRAVVTQVTASLARAEATVILEASPDRVTPPCQHARPGGCGGCDWQHASLDAQRRIKAAVISQQLRRIAGVDCPVTVAPVPGDTGGLGWRTRVSFGVDADGTAGLRRHRSHEIVSIGSCPIAHPLVNQQAVTGLRWPATRSVEVAVSPGPGQAAVVITGAAVRSGNLARIPAGSVLTAARDGRTRARRGTGYLIRRAAGRDWRTGALVFWQVHPGAADALADAVLAALEPRPGQAALDLYCGAGLLAGVLAKAVGPSGRVIGIDADQRAVRDARHNLRATPWARVYRGDVAAVLARTGTGGAALAVLDPPRAGAARKVLDLLSVPDGTLRRICYVSCDPATLARDLAALCRAGWRLDWLRGLDAFPMTHHVECVAALARGLSRGAPPRRHGRRQGWCA